MTGEKFKYSASYIIRSIKIVQAKGWKGFCLVREIACECKRLGVDEFDVLRSFAIHKLTPDGSGFELAFAATAEMSNEELRAILS